MSRRRSRRAGGGRRRGAGRRRRRRPVRARLVADRLPPRLTRHYRGGTRQTLGAREANSTRSRSRFRHPHWYDPAVRRRPYARTGRRRLRAHTDARNRRGGASVIEETDAVVFAHETCARYVDGREDPIKGEGDRYPPVPVDVELVDGERFRTEAGPMEVVFTPGHAPGHVSLYFPEKRLLVAADALTADEDGLQGPSERFTLDMAGAAESVERLAALDVESVHCYHGGTVAADSDRIAEVAESIAA
ncbi:MAG: MBL fold metallo-hydrolase [Haloarculaceae archaeon]